MGFLTGGITYVVPFLVVLTVLVFVHELGHYLVARWNKVRIETFSIGFGPELFGWTDRVGTRWKVSAVPLGGYVKMFGDTDPASMGASEQIERMSDEEKAVSFHHKRLMQRVAVVVAGPAANFVFTVVALAVLFATIGQPFTPPQVGKVEAGSAAAAGGLKPGDTIVRIDGGAVHRFEDIQQAVRLDDGRPLAITVQRDSKELTLSITPRVTTVTDRFGYQHRFPLLGIERQGVNYVRRNPVDAMWRAGQETGNLVSGTLTAVWQMIIGARPADEIGGPLRIAQMSGEVAQGGVVALIWFMAVLSVNLGLINLFPIPVLDGGHLLFYFAEAIRGRPLGARAQEYGFRLGLAVVLTLMVFATWNDLVHIGFLRFLKGFGT
ncbi:MAG: RIP metalloprotease RseP [Alphaproteobacteria bacterium]|nr:RIP metalloprotease RseP [Alphaproteobacteria bacterium]